MLLRHQNPNTGTVVHGDQTFEVDDKGLFDVPEDQGRWLLAHQPGWRLYDGSDESEADRAATFEAENRELRRKLAEVESGTVTPAEKAAAADKAAKAKAAAAPKPAPAPAPAAE